MYEPQHSDASALIATKKKWEEAANLSNPVMSIAASLMKLEDPGKDWSREQVLRALRERAERVEQDDLGGIESMLAAQAQVLHVLFAQAIEKYATCGAPDQRGVYSDLALKSQNLCRMTAATLAYLKQVKAMKRKDRLADAALQEEKTRTEHLREVYRMTLGSRKEEPGSFETWMAAMEKMQE